MTKYNGFSEKNTEAITILRSLILGAAVGCTVCALLLSLCAMLLVKAGTLPVEALPVITTGIGGIGAFFSGYFTVKLYRKRGLLLGVIAGTLLFLIIFVTGLISDSDKELTEHLVKLVVFGIMGSIGGVVRVNKKQKVR